MNKFLFFSLIFCLKLLSQTVLEEAEYPTKRQTDIKPFASELKNIIYILKAHQLKIRKVNYLKTTDEFILNLSVDSKNKMEFFYALTILEALAEIEKFEYEEAKSSFFISLKLSKKEVELQNLSVVLEEIFNITQEEETLLKNVKISFEKNTLLIFGNCLTLISKLQDSYKEKLALIGFQLEEVKQVSNLYQIQSKRFFNPLTQKSTQPIFSQTTKTNIPTEYVFISNLVWEQFANENFVREIQFELKSEKGLEIFNLGANHIFSHVGLLKGDIIVQINDKKLQSIEAAISELSWLKDTNFFQIDIVRNKKIYRFILFRTEK